MLRRCKNCGKEDDEWNMHYFNTGRVQWMCDECYKQGSRDVSYETAERDRRIVHTKMKRGELR